MVLIGIRSFTNVKLWAALVLAALLWSLAAPHCVEASPCSSASDASVAGAGCCGGSAPEGPDYDANGPCSCPSSPVPGFSSAPKIRPPDATSVVLPRCTVAPLSVPETPPAPVPIAGSPAAAISTFFRSSSHSTTPVPRMRRGARRTSCESAALTSDQGHTGQTVCVQGSRLPGLAQAHDFPVLRPGRDECLRHGDPAAGRPSRLAWLSIVGFGAPVCTYPGMSFVRSVLRSYG